MGVDQWLKWWATHHLSFYAGVKIVPGWLDFQLVHNYGAAYGIFQNQRLFLVVFSVLVLALCIRFSHLIVTSEWSRWGLVFLVGGAIGNLIDRLLSGFVIDFINIHIIPVFNIADMCINIGIGCFFVEYIISWRRTRS